MKPDFDELQFFAKVKARPGLYLGWPSLFSLRDQLFGMDHAFHLCGVTDALPCFSGFILWYFRQAWELSMTDGSFFSSPYANPRKYRQAKVRSGGADGIFNC